MPVRYRAVIFDLYGPLVPNLPAAAYEKSFAQMATALGVAPTTFKALWAAAPVQVGDATPTEAIEGCLRQVCEAASVTPNPLQLRMIADSRWNLVRQTHEPRAEAIDALTRLRGRGLSIGMMTDSSVEVPHLWRRSPLARYTDVSIFSCSVGYAKPDPRIYLAACNELEIPPNKCLYVGDGERGELAGAMAAGMDAMLFCPAEERELIMSRDEPKTWAGPVAKTMLSVLWATEEPAFAGVA